MKKTVFVTGVNGMIGTELVKGLLEAGCFVVGIDKSTVDSVGDNFCYYSCNLDDTEKLTAIFNKHEINRIIHLAALAHTADEKLLSWERYCHDNVECAQNVFALAGDIPVLFSSTVDVFGFTNGKTVNAETPLEPVTFYGKSKKLAEEECKKLPHYTIFRFSPVYTGEKRRDIQKRYYLKYPKIAYRIGRGSHYEILNIKKAVHEMVKWCSEEPKNVIRILKDDDPMWTPDYIKAEKSAGRAKLVLYFPRWIVVCGYYVLRAITGKNKYTFLLNKAVYPLKSEEI